MLRPNHIWGLLILLFGGDLLDLELEPQATTLIKALQPVTTANTEKIQPVSEGTTAYDAVVP
ncbi:hypothetical protein [Salinimicrobium soli]|uniref:hypothetical protein n=1 Tax=Salinimicrobium soli TaxID=1254399 RepID=UPI003AABC825